MCLFISLRVNHFHMKISCRFEISFRSKWMIWNPYRFEFHFASIHVNTSKELTEHRSDIFNRNEISHQFEFNSLSCELTLKGFSIYYCCHGVNLCFSSKLTDFFDLFIYFTLFNNFSSSSWSNIIKIVQWKYRKFVYAYPIRWQEHKFQNNKKHVKPKIENKTFLKVDNKH